MAVSPPLDRCSDAFVPFPCRDEVHEGNAAKRSERGKGGLQPQGREM